jgi:hypothetical protein
MSRTRDLPTCDIVPLLRYRVPRMSVLIFIVFVCQHMRTMYGVTLAYLLLLEIHYSAELSPS